MRLSSAMIFVKDLQGMTDFYSNTLGFKPVEETRLDNWVEFDSGSVHFSLHAIPSEIAAGLSVSASSRETTPVKLSFEVADLPGEVERLERLGVRLIYRPWGGIDAVDPEGNVFGLH